ncbi:pentapeptide repeat-containing protein [Streptomyces sp. NPDC005181]|uniref:pentapeptide repeat-containing protein n=1 Tax=Streptomyces sp. NPDC005181 TaxID=3156869 RepID=UPI0033B47E1A
MRCRARGRAPILRPPPPPTGRRTACGPWAPANPAAADLSRAVLGWADLPYARPDRAILTCTRLQGATPTGAGAAHLTRVWRHTAKVSGRPAVRHSEIASTLQEATDELELSCCLAA